MVGEIWSTPVIAPPEPDILYERVWASDVEHRAGLDGLRRRLPHQVCASEDVKYSGPRTANVDHDLLVKGEQRSVHNKTRHSAVSPRDFNRCLPESTPQHREPQPNDVHAVRIYSQGLLDGVHIRVDKHTHPSLQDQVVQIILRLHLSAKPT